MAQVTAQEGPPGTPALQHASPDTEHAVLVYAAYSICSFGHSAMIGHLATAAYAGFCSGMSAFRDELQQAQQSELTDIIGSPNRQTSANTTGKLQCVQGDSSPARFLSCLSSYTSVLQWHMSPQG